MGVTTTVQAPLIPRETSKNSFQQSSKETTMGQNVKPGTHLVRVNFLGLAGVTVDRTRCKEPGSKKRLPCAPETLSAVVAVARDQEMQATTGLSKPLSRSPTRDVVISSAAHPEDSASQASTGSASTQRHIAVWAGNEGSSIGNMVMFHTVLKKLDQGDSHTYVSEYVPQSFELIVALTENSNHENKIAIPIAVATLNVCGDQGADGETHVIDLPLLTLKQAKPLAEDTNGLGGFQMIAVKSGAAGKSKKKRNALKRLFGIQGAGKSQRIPSVDERRAFSSAYSADSRGDAILRIQLQVVELGREAPLERPDRVNRNFIAAGIAPNPPNDDTIENESKSQGQETADDDCAEDSVVSSSSSASPSVKSGSIDSMISKDSRTVRTEGSETLMSDGTGTLTGTMVSDRTGSLTGTLMSDRTGSLTGTLMSDERPEERGPSTLARRSSNNDSVTLNSRGKPLYSPPVSVMSERDDEYTLSFEKRSQDDKWKDLVAVKIFGKEFRLGTCGPMMGYNDDETQAKFFDDNLTHVTGDFFGERLHIPICSGMKPDDDSVTTLSLVMDKSRSTLTENVSLVHSQRDQMSKHFKETQSERRKRREQKKAAIKNKSNDAGNKDPISDVFECAVDVGNMKPTQETFECAFDSGHPKCADDVFEYTLEEAFTTKAADDKAQSTLDKKTPGAPNRKYVVDEPKQTVGEGILIGGDQLMREESDRLDSLVLSTPSSSIRGNLIVEAPDLNVVVQIPDDDAASVSEESVEAVLKVRQLEAKRKTKKSPTGVERFSESFSSMFACGKPPVVEETYSREVPTGVVIQSDGASVGDLTATTHEQNLRRKKPQKQAGGFPLPIACGGTGVFSRKTNLVNRDDTADDLLFCEQGETMREPENYFADYEQSSLPSK